MTPSVAFKRTITSYILVPAPFDALIGCLEELFLPKVNNEIVTVNNAAAATVANLGNLPLG